MFECLTDWSQDYPLSKLNLIADLVLCYNLRKIYIPLVRRYRRLKCDHLKGLVSESLESILNKYIAEWNVYFVGGYNAEPYSHLSKTPLAKVKKSERFVSTQDDNYDDACQSCRKQWVDLKPDEVNEGPMSFPVKRTEGYRITYSNEKIWVIGGFNVDSFKQTSNFISFDGSTWETEKPLTQGRFFHAAWSDDEQVIVAGGYQQEKVLGTTEIYNIKTKTWKFGDTMPLGVGGSAFCGYKQYLFVCCGQYSVRAVHTTDKIQRYSTDTNQWDIFSRYISPGMNVCIDCQKYRLHQVKRYRAEKINAITFAVITFHLAYRLYYK